MIHGGYLKRPAYIREAATRLAACQSGTFAQTTHAGTRCKFLVLRMMESKTVSFTAETTPSGHRSVPVTAETTIERRRSIPVSEISGSERRRGGSVISETGLTGCLGDPVTAGTDPDRYRSKVVSAVTGSERHRVGVVSAVSGSDRCRFVPLISETTPVLRPFGSLAVVIFAKGALSRLAERSGKGRLIVNCLATP
jgi:hypothetical protein